MTTAHRTAGLLAFSLCVLLGAAEGAPVVFPGEAWSSVNPGTQGCDAELLAQAAERFGSLCGKDGSSQMVVVRNGHVIYAGTDIDNRHIVYSCTKSFLSTCFGLLWDDGACTPETLVAEIIPELAASYPTMTLGQLLTFTGGYASTDKRLREPAAPLYAPGTAMHYGEQSNLLALALTQLAGEPLHDLFMRRIGTPIGITAAELSWGLQDLPDERIPVNGGTGAPEAGLAITARAMARVCWLYCQGGVWNGTRLIGADYVALATTVRVPADLPPHDPKGWYAVLPGHYGLNWWVNGTAGGPGLMWEHLPASSFAMQGNRNNIGIIIPEWNTVVVRLGTEPAVNVQSFDQAMDLLHQALIKGGGLPGG